MQPTPASAALVALLRTGQRPWKVYAGMVEDARDAFRVLEQERGLLAQEQADRAAEDVVQWEADGMRLVTVLDADYPENLRTVHDRPPLIFVAGRLEPRDARSIAVVGSRRASAPALSRARAIAEHLVHKDYTVVSGLAAGIDTAAHAATLEAGGRTVAVIGTGLRHCYPPENGQLQRTIAGQAAVVSQFWPDAPPTRRTFPMRNAIMSGLALATVVVEATHRSGSRMQARLALAHGRPVFLPAPLVQEQRWAKQLAGRPSVHVINEPAEITDAVERLTDSGTLVA
jgi:DNA processing protein